MPNEAPLKVEIWYNLLTRKPVNSIPSIKGSELELFCHGLDIVYALGTIYEKRQDSLRGYMDRKQPMAHVLYDQKH